MFASWWLVRFINSILSFTLIVFTIPLAFDVGGRDCGLVRSPVSSSPLCQTVRLPYDSEVCLVVCFAAVSGGGTVV